MSFEYTMRRRDHPACPGRLLAASALTDGTLRGWVVGVGLAATASLLAPSEAAAQNLGTQCGVNFAGTGLQSAGNASGPTPGNSSFACGFGTNAIGDNATAVGNFSNAIGTGATATGFFSRAIGTTATADGQAAVANGTQATAVGSNSLAEGTPPPRSVSLLSPTAPAPAPLAATPWQRAQTPPRWARPAAPPAQTPPPPAL